jgi:hypothetical protein
MCYCMYRFPPAGLNPALPLKKSERGVVPLRHGFFFIFRHFVWVVFSRMLGVAAMRILIKVYVKKNIIGFCIIGRLVC